MGLEFVAVDVETANAFRGSVCQIGLVRVRGGCIVGEWESLLQPPAGHGWVDYGRGQIHGLTTRLLSTQPMFDAVWPQVLRRLEGQVLVAHNAAFDVTALREASEAGGFGTPEFDYVCSLVLARRHLDLPANTLDAVAAACGVHLDRHHDALADARAAAEITLALAARVGAGTLVDLLTASGVSLGSTSVERQQTCHAIGNVPIQSLALEPRLF